jgi:hypothetical protein
MLDGLLEHLEAHLGDIAGSWETDPDGNELPFHIVHYAGKASPGTEIFSTLGLSDYELGAHGDRVELLMIAPVGLTAGTVPPILLHAGVLPIDADEVPELGDTYTAVGELGEVSPMDALYVGRPLYQPAEFNPFEGHAGRVVFWWLIPIYDVEAEYVEAAGWEAFEQLMWDLDVDPTDFTREPWLDE